MDLKKQGGPPSGQSGKDGILGYILIGLTIFIFGFQSIGETTGARLRWDIWDQLLHFFGGVWMATIFLYFFINRLRLFNIYQNRWLTAFFVLSFVALVGIVWEFFEYAVGFIFQDHWVGTAEWGVDTLSDLFLDFAGGILAALAFYALSAKKFLF